MKKRYDVVAVGESLIDFTPAGTNELGMQLFSRNPGGAPANVLAMFAKLGGETAFIGRVGNDPFGAFLTQTMREARIDVSGMQRDDEVPTTLAFVQLDEKGERSFSFYRNPGADMMLRQAEIPAALIEGCKVLHFGSVSLTHEPSCTATLTSVQAARAAGAVISYDPNFRSFLWADLAEAKQRLLAAVSLAHLLKVSEDEMVLLTGQTELKKGAAQLARLGPQAVIVTLGENGAYFYTAKTSGIVKTYDVSTVDTTGAGDAFWGAVLHRLRDKSIGEIETLPAEAWCEILQFANAAGSLTTIRKGAIPAMPTMEEIRTCMSQCPLLTEDCAEASQVS